MNNAEIVVAPSIHEATKALKWRHKYDKMIFLKLQGYSLEEIGAEVGVNLARVSVVLCSRQGKERLAIWEERLAERGLSVIEQGMVSLGRKSVENIAQTINAEVSPNATRRKQHQDKVSFELLSRIGFGKKETSANKDDGGLNGLSAELQERLVSALEQSAEATRLDALPFEIDEAEDASD